MQEIWKPVVGYEGLYEVSSLGRVRSLDRLVDTGRPGWSKARRRGRILVPVKTGARDYLKVILSREGSVNGYLIHVLVLQTFRGLAPAGHVGCHNEGPSNTLENLRWDTPSNNVRDTHRNGRRVSRKGVPHFPNEYIFENLPGEKWRSVLGYEGIYEVSDMGRIKSLDRLVTSGSRVLHRRGHLKRLSPIHNGYLTVGLSRDGHNINQLVHIVVLEAFKGLCPEGMVACHGPEGSSMNWLSNLRWDTPSENNYDQRRHRATKE